MRVNKSSSLILMSLVMIMTATILLWSSPNRAYGLFSSGLEGKPLPQINLPSLYGSKRFTRNAIVGRPALLNVWASWCHYCKIEHNMLLTIKNQYHVPIYGIDYRDEPEDGRAWLARAGNPFVMVGLDQGGLMESVLGITGTPATFVIDKHGYVRYQYVGGITEGLWVNTIWPIVQKLNAEK